MKNINQSLIKFHASLKPIAKDAQNPFFKSDYLTLSGILDAVRPLLASVDLALVQSMRVDGERTILITKIMHASGEEILSEMILPHNSDPQKYGTLITYYKRYQLQALLGISTTEEDDDGNSVSRPDLFRVKKIDPPKPTFQVEGIGPQVPLSESMPKNVATFPASAAQKGLLKKLGIKFDDDITKAGASKLIEEANKRN
jgi:hypothetical protein